jgi:hypothetical protein
LATDHPALERPAAGGVSEALVPRPLRVPGALTALALGGWVASAVAMNG